MIGEISIGGVYVPSLLIWGLVALALNLVLRRLLAAIGFYRLVWHRALFDLALFIIVLAGVVGASARLLEP
jgi:protein AaeX